MTNLAVASVRKKKIRLEPDHGVSETRKEVYTLYNRRGISQALLASFRNQLWQTSREELIGKISEPMGRLKSEI